MDAGDVDDGRGGAGAEGYGRGDEEYTCEWRLKMRCSRADLHESYEHIPSLHPTSTPT
jgi:hypothetical protein